MLILMRNIKNNEDQLPQQLTNCLLTVEYPRTDEIGLHTYIILIGLISSHFLADTVFLVLPLADEYQIESLKKECHQVMLQMMEGKCSLEKQLQIYSQTEKYSDLDEVAKKSVSMLRICSLNQLQQYRGYSDLMNKLPIAEERVKLLETKISRFRLCIPCELNTCGKCRQRIEQFKYD